MKLIFKKLLLIFLIAVPPILLILPKNFFDNGPVLCISKLFTQKECYACGITRGIMHLIHLDFEKAYEFNMLSFIVFPLLGVIWIQWIVKEYKLYKKLKAIPNSNTL